MISINSPSGAQLYSGRVSNSMAVAEPSGFNKSLATTMPSNRQTTQGIMHPEEPNNTSGDYAKWKKSKLFHPRQAFSAVTAETFLKAKADFSPVFMHNMGATKRALTSVMEVDKPRHSEQVNILA